MPALVARIQPTVPLLLALLVPVAFIACDVGDPVAPTDLVSSTADAKGDNGKGGGPGGGGGDDGDSGGGDPGTSAPTVEATLLDFGYDPGTEVAPQKAAGDYLVGWFFGDGCGFVYNTSTGGFTCISIPNSLDGGVHPYDVDATGRVVGHYTAADDGLDNVFVYHATSGTLEVFDAPPGWDEMTVSFHALSSNGTVLVEVFREDPAVHPHFAQLGLLDLTSGGVTIAAGPDYEFLSGRALTDDGIAVAWAREDGQREISDGVWNGSSATGLVPLPGSDGRKGADMYGAFDRPGGPIYGNDGDRLVIWRTPTSTPETIGTVDLRPRGHGDTSRILGFGTAKGNALNPILCMNLNGGVTELLPPDGYERAFAKTEVGGKVYGEVKNEGSPSVPAVWDVSNVEGGC